MSNILSILRTTHCRSTHHYFALDALQNMQTAQGQRLANLLLKFHDDYLVGAKAPDSNFRDFQNHVVHVQQNNWGGAAIQCQQWLKQAREYLDKGKWKKAAYACGVLSHYFTDPLMPLHTAQSAKEQVVHRPLEWSIYKSYNRIYERAKEISCEIRFSAGDDWVSKAVLTAAQFANRYYDPLIDLYDLNQSTQVPSMGLNDEMVDILAELFAMSITGLTQVLTRLADETTAQLPQVSLTITSLLASIDRPLAWVVKRLSDSGEQRAVQALLSEFHKTGSVSLNLPKEVTVVQQARLSQPTLGTELQKTAESVDVEPLPEVVAAARSQQEIKLPDVQENVVATRRDTVSSESVLQSEPRSGDQILPLASSSGTNDLDSVVESSKRADQAISQMLEHHDQVDQQNSDATNVDSFESNLVALSLAPRPLRLHRQDEVELAANLKQNEAVEESGRTASPLHAPAELDSANAADQEKRPLRVAPGTVLPDALRQSAHVHYDSPLQEAPSIGPKTAKRFEKIGILTIRDFVGASTGDLVEDLDTRWITVDLVRDWQDQARLVCEVPALTGYRAQLLVAINCRTSWQLRTGNAVTLTNQLDQFCQTAEGQQIIRSASIPTAEDVKSWIESARKYARRDVA